MTILTHFFHYGYADHRDLHSFPTRRSSDLPDEPKKEEKKEDKKPDAAKKDAAKDGKTDGTAKDKPAAEAPPKPVVIDRKSTRLNSSHLGISYAVFCLKKKKKKIAKNKQTIT